MSYILDALKKSSEERRKRQELEGQQEHLVFDPATVRSTAKRWPRLTIIVIALCLAGAGGWWLSQPNGLNTMQQRIVPPMDGDQIKSEEPEVQDNVISENAHSQTEQKIVQVEPSREPENRDSEAGTLMQPKAEPIDTIPLYEELPFSLRSQLPDLKYSGHVFSENPALRMILINTTVVREGEQVTADLKLVEITPTGLIMEFQNSPYRLDLF